MSENGDAHGSHADPGATGAERELPANPEEALKLAKDHGWQEQLPDSVAAESGHFSGDWFSNPVTYEYDGEAGDIGPEVPALEQQLFSTDLRQIKGDHLSVYAVEVDTEGPEKPRAIMKFEDAGFHPQMLANLDKSSYLLPTPVQIATMDPMQQSKDLLVTAVTGSGKTVAYLAPTISKFMGKWKKVCKPRPNPARYNPDTDRIRAEPIILVLAPTRELAAQIYDEARRLSYRSMLRPCVLYGGGPMKVQLEELGKGCDILIGTPGRIIDCMNRPGVLGMNRVKVTIIDEADEIFKGEWIDDIKRILMGNDANEDDDHQYMMFSATFSPEIREVADDYLAPDKMVIRIGRVGATHANIHQDIFLIDPPKRKVALYDLLMSRNPMRTVVFTNTTFMAEEVDDFLYSQRLPVTLLHSGLTQREREDALRAFKIGSAPILVCTAIGARGLDIKSIMHVINFELPSMTHGGIDEYVHRIGRTARIGHKGLASSFFTERDAPLAEKLVSLLKESNQVVQDWLQAYADGASPEEGGEVQPEGDSFGGDNAEPDGFKPDGDNNEASAW